MYWPQTSLYIAWVSAGTLPSEWVSLQSLLSLDLLSNNVTGALPHRVSCYEPASLPYEEHKFPPSSALHAHCKASKPSVWPIAVTVPTPSSLKLSCAGSLPSSWSSLRSVRKINFESNSLTGEACPAFFVIWMRILKFSVLATAMCIAHGVISHCMHSAPEMKMPNI